MFPNPNPTGPLETGLTLVVVGSGLVSTNKAAVCCQSITELTTKMQPDND